MSKYAIILDTEGYSNKGSYNIGYTVVDFDNFQIVKKESIAILPYLWDNLKEKLRRNLESENGYLSTMYLNNAEDILMNSNKKYKLIKTELGLYKHFLLLFKKYDISDFFAFNVAFDRGALKRSLKEKHYDKLFSNMNFHDIQTAVFYTFCNNLEYVKFCLANNYLTKRGYCQCKAETFYRYISKEISFNEEHTALADAIIETEMLIKALQENPHVSTEIIKPYSVLSQLYDKDDPETVFALISDYLFE